MASYPNEYVEITVRDSGSGMSAEVARKALEPFFTTKSLGQGTGLGLSSIARFANAIGGAVRIESEAGQGTSVSLLLPKESPDTTGDSNILLS